MSRWRHRGMQQMLADIRCEAGLTRHLIGKASLERPVMDAMARVARDEFVPDEMKQHAFDNGPLPIGHGQTISQPYIVALMTDLLEPKRDQRVLEIGTGSGYQTAVLSLLYRQVYSMERVPALTDAASRRLARLGYTNIELSCGNGYRGWPAHAPYDAILVTAAAPHIPEPLRQQLTPGGRLVIPVGPSHMSQQLLLVEKDEQGHTRTRHILRVAFVPLLDQSPAVSGE